MGGSRWSDRDDERLIDLFYDAAGDETLWPEALEQLGDRVRAHPGNLIDINFTDGRGSGLATRAPEDIMTRYFADWAHRNPIALAENAARYRIGWTPRITRDNESIDRHRLERSAFWNEFLVPIGAYHLTIFRLALRGDAVTTITLGRPNHLGPFEDAEIDSLRHFHRHLVRAERLWRTMSLRQAELDQFDTFLAQSSEALFFLDDQFKLLRWTARADVLLRENRALAIVGGHLRAAHSDADAALQRALTSVLQSGAPPPFVINEATPGKALVLSVARLGERTLGGFSGGRCLLVSARPVARTGALQSQYELTAAENELALALCRGDSLSTFAARRGVSIYTVRNQLAAVFDKTACRRQVDLVRLLTGKNEQ